MIRYTHIASNSGGQLALVILLLVLEIFTVLNSAVAWNVSGHILSSSIAYQILRDESPDMIAAVQAILETRPWKNSVVSIDDGK